MDDHQTPGAALEWAASRVPVASASIITEQPWARIHKITSNDRVYYLKQVSPDAARSQRHIPILSDAGGAMVPRVLDHDAKHNVFLFEDFVGEVFRDKLNATEKRAALETYAKIQCACIGNADLADALPALDCRTVLARFMGLVRSAMAGQVPPDTPGNPFAYMSQTSLRGYLEVLEPLEGKLRDLMALADDAPCVINHCDLRQRNVARRKSGELVIFDWDDAVWAPPGLSLQAQFSGCSRIVRAMLEEQGWGSPQQLEDRQVLDAYIAALQSHPAFGPHDLRKILTATACAGVFIFLLSFAPYRVERSSVRSSIKKNTRRRMSDLLTCLEYLSVRDPDLRTRLHDAYVATGRNGRARGLRALSRQPDTARQMPAAAPYDISDLRRAHDREARADAAAAAFRENGVLVLRDIFDKALISECRARFFDALDSHNADIARGSALRVGDKRYMLSLGLEGVFARPELLAAPALQSVLQRLLYRDFVLGSFTAVASAPGARDQSIHRDNPPLFAEDPGFLVPSFCIAAIIPLVDLTEKTGTTRVWPGSHRLNGREYDRVTPVDPLVETGSCYLMDSRLFHRGLANRSDRIRPILSLVFQRPWYRDHKNFNHQDAVRLGASTKATLDKSVARLVSWVSET